MNTPYPADTRAKGWRFELDLEQISQSDTWALAPQDVRPWLLMLWSVSWQQVPCGSLPGEDAIIAARIGMKAAAFAKNKAVLLRGWVLADDGRLYHPTITQRVLSMLEAKQKEKDRKAAYRARMSASVPRDNHWTDPGCDDTGTGTGTGTGLKTMGNQAAHTDLDTAAAAQPDPIGARSLELVVLLRKRGASIAAGNAYVRQWAESGVTDAQALTALETAERRRAEAGSVQPVNAGFLDSILTDTQRAPPRRTTIHEERAATIAALTGRSRTHEHEPGNIIDVTPTATAGGVD
jgi:hypothetical protein